MLDAKNLGISIKGVQKKLSNLLYADDIILFAESKVDLQALLDVAAEWADKYHMEFNVKKCGRLMLRTNEGAIIDEPVKFDFKIQGQSIPHVASYKYLGLWINQKMYTPEIIQERVKATQVAFARISPVLKWKHLSLQVKMSLVQTMVASTALYGVVEQVQKQI